MFISQTDQADCFLINEVRTLTGGHLCFCLLPLTIIYASYVSISCVYQPRVRGVGAAGDGRDEDGPVLEGVLLALENKGNSGRDFAGLDPVALESCHE